LIFHSASTSLALAPMAGTTSPSRKVPSQPP